MKKKLWIKLFITCAVITFVFIFFDIDLKQAFESIRSQRFLFFALLIPIIINPIISNNRWKIFLKVQGVNERIINLIKISFKSIFLGIALPATAGSDAIRIFQIEKRHPLLLGVGGASVIFERLLGFLILSFLGIVGGIIAIFYDMPYNILFIITIIHLLVWVVFIVIKNKYLYKKATKFLMKFKSSNRIINYMDSIYYAINNFPIKKVLFSSIPLILAFQLFTIVCGFLIFKAFDINLPFYYHLAFLPVIQIISIIPISLSGFGLREGGFVYFYGLLGIDGNISFFVSLLYYAILVLVPAIIGMLLYLFDKQNLKPKN